MGPPAAVLEMGKFIHACEGEMVVESTNPKIPHFNAPIYLENKVRPQSPMPGHSLWWLILTPNKTRPQSAKLTKSSAR